MTGRPPRITRDQRRALSGFALVLCLTILLALLVAARTGLAPGF